MIDSCATCASKSSSTHRSFQHVALLSAPTTHRIATQTGTAPLLRKGQVLRVTDPLGQQVSNLFAFEQGNLNRWLSPGRSIEHASKNKPSTGDTRYSNDNRLMFTILFDTEEHNYFFNTPCSEELFEILCGCSRHHFSCFENLIMSSEVDGVTAPQIHTTCNIFMEVNVDADGALQFVVHRLKAGDLIELRVEINLSCGLTACSAEGSNNGTFKPIDYAVGEIAGVARSDVSVSVVQGRCLTRSGPYDAGTSAQSPPQEVRQQRVVRGKLG